MKNYKKLLPGLLLLCCFGITLNTMRGRSELQKLSETTGWESSPMMQATRWKNPLRGKPTMVAEASSTETVASKIEREVSEIKSTAEGDKQKIEFFDREGKLVFSTLLEVDHSVPRKGIAAVPSISGS